MEKMQEGFLKYGAFFFGDKRILPKAALLCVINGKRRLPLCPAVCHPVMEGFVQPFPGLWTADPPICGHIPLQWVLARVSMPRCVVV